MDLLSDVFLCGALGSKGIAVRRSFVRGVWKERVRKESVVDVGYVRVQFWGLAAPEVLSKRTWLWLFTTGDGFTKRGENTRRSGTSPLETRSWMLETRVALVGSTKAGCEVSRITTPFSTNQQMN